MNTETWKPLDWINSTYEISSNGAIRNIKTLHLKATRIVDGYVLAKLTVDGVEKLNVRVHRLVAEAFLRTEDNKDCNIVNHLDGNRSNNHISNLEWTTVSGNNNHTLNEGRHVSGLKKPNAKPEEVNFIKRLYHSGMSSKEIGKLLSRSTSTIGRILKRVA